MTGPARALLVMALLVVTDAAASPSSAPGSTARVEAPWSAGAASVAVEGGAPVVVRVIIPLCSNDQIDCGAVWAGQPGRAKTNIYWGAIFGARTLFDGKRSGWEAVDTSKGPGPIVERAVYRRHVDGRAWGLDESVEQIAVLDAFHGDRIDDAVRELMETAAAGGTVTFPDAGRERSLRLSAVGYAGHNRLMDGVPLPRVERSDHAIPSFVLACNSEPWFRNALLAVGSRPLVMTRALMAPEGYVVLAAVKAIGDNASDRGVKDGVVRAYAKWQKLSLGAAGALFSK